MHVGTGLRHLIIYDLLLMEERSLMAATSKDCGYFIYNGVKNFSYRPTPNPSLHNEIKIGYFQIDDVSYCTPERV